MEEGGVQVGEEGLIPVDHRAVRGSRWVGRYTDGRVWTGGRLTRVVDSLFLL